MEIAENGDRSPIAITHRLYALLLTPSFYNYESATLTIPFGAFPATDYASPGSFGLTNALCLFHEANNIVQDKVYLPPYSTTPLTAHPYPRYVCLELQLAATDLPHDLLSEILPRFIFT